MIGRVRGKVGKPECGRGASEVSGWPGSISDNRVAYFGRRQENGNAKHRRLAPGSMVNMTYCKVVFTS